MASLATSRTTAHIRPSGLAGLFGLFAGLCAIFAACATVVDWHHEFTQTKWPIVSAIVERADVLVLRRAPNDGGGMSWKLNARVRYEASGKSRTAVLTSRTVYSEQEAAQLHAWAGQHRSGSQIEIRHDPHQPGRGVFASAEGAFTSERIRNHLILFTPNPPRPHSVHAGRDRISGAAGTGEGAQDARGKLRTGCRGWSRWKPRGRAVLCRDGFDDHGTGARSRDTRRSADRG